MNVTTMKKKDNMNLKNRKKEEVMPGLGRKQRRRYYNIKKLKNVLGQKEYQY